MISFRKFIFFIPTVAVTLSGLVVTSCSDKKENFTYSLTNFGDSFSVVTDKKFVYANFVSDEDKSFFKITYSSSKSTVTLVYKIVVNVKTEKNVKIKLCTNSGSIIDTIVIKVVLLPPNSDKIPTSPPLEELSQFDQERIDYLNDITFPLGISEYINSSSGIVSESGYYCTSFGTSWIFNKTGEGDYSYWMVTNYHVVSDYIESHESNNANPSIFAFGIGDPNELKTYYKFTKSELEDNENMIGDPLDGTTFNSIDLSVMKVDFSKRVDGLPKEDKSIEDSQDDVFGLKERLDKINLSIEEKSSVFNSINSDVALASNENPNYILGYPWINDNQILEYHVVYETFDGFGSEISHPIDGKDSVYIDTSPSITFGYKDSKWMSHGSSGAAVIDKDYNLVGIYWGGFGNSITFIPVISVIKDHLNDYL